MSSSREDRDLLLRYLLGEVSASETVRLDEQLLSDDDFSERLREAQHDLQDAYVSGRLSSTDRQRVEQALLRSERQREEFGFTRAFQQRIAVSPKAKSASFFLSWKLAFTLSAIAAVLIAAFLINRPNPGRNDLALDQRPPTTAPSPAVGSSPAVRTFAVVLSPEVLRGASTVRKVTVPAGVSAIDLQVLLPAAANAKTNFGLDVQLATGQRIASFSSLHPAHVGSAYYVQAQIPAAQLPPGEYRCGLYEQSSSDKILHWYPVEIARTR